MSDGSIPGLRHVPIQGFLYVKRYSDEKYAAMIDRFVGEAIYTYPDEIGGINMPPFRVTLPNGDRYYPMAFHGDLAQWPVRLQRAAEVYHTMLARFDHGKFVLSDGQVFDFAALKVDRMTTRKDPADW